MKKYTQEVTVTESHLDQLQHVNNVQYLQWVQDIAGAHWQSLIKGSKETFGLW
ncbi:MAG: thioesterase, partial [Flavobacteriaceae bacterium]|nr:thioesterase [Flavobacteriaceae bacterium]